MTRGLLHLRIVERSDDCRGAGGVRGFNCFYTKAGQHLTPPTQHRAISRRACHISLQRDSWRLVFPSPYEWFRAELLKRSPRCSQPSEHRDQIVICAVGFVFIVHYPDSQSGRRHIELENLGKLRSLKLISEIRSAVNRSGRGNGKSFPLGKCDEFAFLLSYRIAVRVSERPLDKRFDRLRLTPLAHACLRV